MTVGGNGAERAQCSTSDEGQAKGICHFNEAIKNLLTFVGLSGRCQQNCKIGKSVDGPRPFVAYPILCADLSIDYGAGFTTEYLFLWVFYSFYFFFVLLGFTKGLAVFKVLTEQSLAIKLATPEIYNCQTLYAPFGANCRSVQPLRRLWKCAGKSDRWGVHLLQQRGWDWGWGRRQGHWKTGSPETKLSLQNGRASGKRKRSNCLIRIQSKGSLILYSKVHIQSHSPWPSLLLTSFTVTFAGEQQSGLISGSVALDFFWAFRFRCSFKGRRSSCPFDLHIGRIRTKTTTAQQ